MASAGRILIMPKGDYDANNSYEMLDLVKHNGVSWLAKKTATGIEPRESNSEYWHKMFDITAVNSDCLPKSGGKITGSTKVERTFEDTTVSTELFPNDGHISDERISSFGHYRADVLIASLCFNEKGAGIRDNVNNIFYNFYGEHNLDSLKSYIKQVIEEHLSNDS